MLDHTGRKNWDAPASLRNFTFILHQLSAYSNKQGKPGTDLTIPGLRWSRKNDEFCMIYDELCIKNDEFQSKAPLAPG